MHLLQAKNLKELLQQQEDERDKIADEMVTFAKELKDVHLRTRDQLAEDNRVSLWFHSNRSNLNRKLTCYSLPSRLTRKLRRVGRKL